MSTAELIPVNYREEQPIGLHTQVMPKQDLFVQGTVTIKKPPRQVKGEFCITTVYLSGANKPRKRDTEDLNDTYVLENRTAVTNFIAENRLHGLLLEAKAQLKEKFGATAIKALEIVSDDEGFDSLLCLISATGTLQENMDALRAFDREWWLGQVGKSAGRLNFDFQLV